MRNLSARTSRLCAVTLMFFLFVASSLVRPAQAQSEEISEQDIAVHYSLYYEDFKNQNFESALPNLLWIIENAPAYPRNDDVNFERLVDLYAGLAENAEDEEMKSAYLDSALVTFDRAGPILEEAGAEFEEVPWLIQKGRFIQEHSEFLPDARGEVAEIYRAAYAQAGCEVDPYYVRVIIDDFVRSDEKNAAVELLDEAEACYSEDGEMTTFITEVRNSLFTSPDERMAFLEDRIEKDPENVELVAELFDIYLELGERDKAGQLGETLLDMQPSARTYRLLAKMHLEDGEAEEALALYEEALELPGAEDLRRDIYFNMGIARQELGDLSGARSDFRRAVEEDPGFGQAYLAIGDLYATAVSDCGSFERDDRAVYWLAVDYYERAKATNPDLSSQANQKINTYRRSFPDQEMLFFKNWEPGQSHRIDYGCYSWIGEATTVRSP